MKVLLITNRVPFPADGGYAIVVNQTIKALKDLGCELTLFSLNTTKHFVSIKEIKDPLFKQVKFVQYKIDNRVKAKDAFLNLFSDQSYNISRFYHNGCASKLGHLVRTGEFDLIQFEGLQVAPYLDVVKGNTNAKLVYRAHNIEHQIWKRLSIKENFFIRKFYLHLLSKRLQNFEVKILNSFDALIAISFVDEHFFKSIGCEIPIYTFPVALNLENYKNNYLLSPNKSVGYIGSMDWRPNIEGVEWFIENVWPSIQQLDSGITFHLAGKNIPKQFKITGDASFIVEGEVKNAAEFISRQHVLIVPLLSGSGMRVKIIEAMALGKCIIATSIAAEGINYHHDKNILIADKADDFYKQILRCFTDKNLITKIGEGARKLVEKNHDNVKLSKSLLKVYQDLCETKAQ
jgi:glycosyltransferase involved in cell wall biosynthesis